MSDKFKKVSEVTEVGKLDSNDYILCLVNDISVKVPKISLYEAVSDTVDGILSAKQYKNIMKYSRSNEDLNLLKNPGIIGAFNNPNIPTKLTQYVIIVLPYQHDWVIQVAIAMSDDLIFRREYRGDSKDWTDWRKF